MARLRVPVILDIEASGFGKGSFPIEIGVISESGEVYAWLVKPQSHWTHWTSEAESLHGISLEQLHQQGVKPSIVADQLNDIFEGQILYSDGWGMDSSWLSLLFYTAQKKMQFKLDTILNVLSDYQMTHWDTTKALMMQEMQVNLHRAPQDAALIQRTYIETARQEQRR